MQTYTYSLQPVRGALDVGTECTALPVDLVTDQAAEDLGGSDSQGSATVACGFEVRTGRTSRGFGGNRGSRGYSCITILGYAAHGVQRRAPHPSFPEAHEVLTGFESGTLHPLTLQGA